MLNFSDISIRRGTRVLFENATFNLYRGEKIGITGENGSGKSTLLALVRGEVTPETGSFDMPGNLAVAHVAQELSPSDDAAIEFVLDGDAELRATEQQLAAAEAADDGHRLADLYGHYDAIGGYHARSRAATLLHGLGFATSDEQRAVREFSGGWRVRLNVARALMSRSDLLLLDEPTNHLDPAQQLGILERLHGLTRAGAAVIASLHEPNLALRFADRLWLLSGTGETTAVSAGELEPGHLARLYGINYAETRLGNQRFMAPG